MDSSDSLFPHALGCIEFDVTSDRLQNQDNFQVIYCNIADQRFNTICDVAIQTVNCLKILLILQLAFSDVKIGQACAVCI